MEAIFKNQILDLSNILNEIKEAVGGINSWTDQTEELVSSETHMKKHRGEGKRENKESLQEL